MFRQLAISQDGRPQCTASRKSGLPAELCSGPGQRMEEVPATSKRTQTCRKSIDQVGSLPRTLTQTPIFLQGSAPSHCVLLTRHGLPWSCGTSNIPSRWDWGHDPKMVEFSMHLRPCDAPPPPGQHRNQLLEQPLATLSHPGLAQA